ncbi:DUF5696 domain-containing protein [Paenibacillus cisolokensis]|uniref:DUF5696 domain-containing protein n=1 Tax=Paenibacillus cisolokensis TaxID=1658519 RepID=UPI003D291DCE
MKRHLPAIRPLLMLPVIVLAALAAGCSPEPADPASAVPLDGRQAAAEESRDAMPVSPDAEPIPGMEAVLESKQLRLYISRTTAEIAVLHKASGTIWRSNPEDRESDSLATPNLKGRLGAQLALTYLTHNGQTKEYDSFNDSVRYNQFEIKRSEQEVTVTFQFGSPEKGLESIPAQMSKERFEDKLLSALADQKDKDAVISRFKLDDKAGVYVRREIPNSAVKRLVELFEKAGYTAEDLAIDNADAAGGEGAAANPKFTVPLTYRLDGGELVATVDASAIVEGTPPFRLYSLGLLNNFGAAGKADSGYIFLPDGSGALMELNSGKNWAQPIVIPIYGDDGAIAVDEKISQFETSRMPVFGMRKNGSAFLAVIEEGDAMARLTADIAGRLHDYNTVGAQFTLLPRDTVRLSQNEAMIKTPKNGYKGLLSIRYAFLEGENADYSGMASYYRGYLEKKHDFVPLSPEGDSPFYVELAGGVPKQRSFLGVPYETLVPLSTYRQAVELVEKLNAGQVRNVRLKYSGWFNNGVRHQFPDDIKRDGKLGSQQEWEALANRLKEGGGALYPDVAFMRVYRSGNGFRPSADAAQLISRRFVKVYEFLEATYQKDYRRFSHYLLSPSALGDTVARFLDDYGKYNPGTLSLRDLGGELYSDFRLRGEVLREEAKRIVVREAARIREAAPDLMISGGNAYLLPYVRHVLDVPLTGSGYKLAMESVPFYQMVLHGYIDYAGKPYNLAEDQDTRINVLKSLETGSSVYYSWILEDPAILKNTRYNDLYAHNGEMWLDEAVEAYREVNGVLKKVRGKPIVRHEKLAKGVFRTTYGGGLKVTVNYNGKSANADGAVIGPRDYVVEE